MIHYEKQIFANFFDVLCNIFFKEHLPEEGDNRWPKHVAGYAVYSIPITGLDWPRGWREV
jgi:hypothetical protein